MQRVRQTVRGHGAPGGDQGLRGDLAAEDARHEGGAAGAAEDVLLDLLQVEQIEEIRQCLVQVGYRPIDLAMIDFMISLVPP